MQNNGHNIYKIACKYKELNNIFSLEVQTKSLPFYVIIGQYKTYMEHIGINLKHQRKAIFR